MKKLLLTSVAALFLATGAAHAEPANSSRQLVSDCRYSDDTYVENCRSPNYHRCDVVRFGSTDDGGPLELNDLLELQKKLQKFIPLLRKCEAFYKCAAKRDGLDTVKLKPGEKRPRHCYWPTRELGPSP
jgi:hypothetical protein